MSLFPSDRTILDLCSGTGGWSQPYADAGYHVVRVEWKDGADVRLWPSARSESPRLPRELEDINEWIGRVHGILAAPVCTVFSGAGAKHPRTDDDIREGLALVDACFRLCHVLRPQWWALENPVGKLRKWLGPPAWAFDPCDFGDPYTKRTLLWGTFNRPHLCRVEPQGARPGQPNDWYSKVGGKSEATKTYRSATPPGFARAFFAANP
jgi:hypothetical protein